MKTKTFLPKRAVILTTLLIPMLSFGQLYLGLGPTHVAFSQRNDFGYDRSSPVGVNLLMGYRFRINENEKLLLSAEVLLNTHSFYRTRGFNEFRHNYYNAQIPVLANFEVMPQLWIETGVALQVMSSSMRKEGIRVLKGTGHNNFDLQLAVGARKEFNDWVALSLRFNYGALPWFSYEPIGPFGEIGPRESDMYARQISLHLLITL